MSDLMVNNTNEQTSEKALFCRKCGHKLLTDSECCTNCGTTIEYVDDNLPVVDNETQRETNNAVITQKSVSKKKKLKGILLGAFVLTITIVVGFLLSKLFIIKTQNINVINGCPEFYDLKWGMSALDADELIKLEHTVFPASRNFDSKTFELTYTSDSNLLIDSEKTFYLYGRKTDGIHTYFDGDSLNSVIITFSKEKYSLDEIVKLYTKIYGSPSEKEELFYSWYGSKTEISVFDFEPISENGDKTIAVRYSSTENSKYTVINFNGDELDPCGFLSSNYAFDKVPDYYIEDLKKGEDYDMEVYSPEGFSGHTQYLLYPSFEYMGIEAGMTAIELNQDENEDYIGLVSYEFLLNETNAVDRIEYIYSKLSEKYGMPTDIGYTSTYYAKMGIKDLTYDETINQISNKTEGLYHIQWKLSERTITLCLGILVDKEYYEGSVSYSN